MNSKSEIEHWKIKATVYKDRVEEIHYITDPAATFGETEKTQVWRVERSLGVGGFGEVHLQRNVEDRKTRAVKRIVTSMINLELAALLEFSKPKAKEAAVFVDFFGWFEDGSEVFLAMEYLPLGDLEKNVAAHSGKVTEIEARDITKQILLGLKIMHAESFAHRDLKPQNVLVVNGPPKWRVKLADFGLSKRLESTAYHTEGGTQAYMAPEVLNYLDPNTRRVRYTNAVDLWAVGCIVYRLVTGIVPFSPTPWPLIKYCKDKLLFPNGPLSSSGFKQESSCSSFIRELLAAEPKERPSATQALNHPWIISSGYIFPKLSQLFLDPSAAEIPDNLVHQNEDMSGLSDHTVLAYNTATHEGLKSHHQPSSLMHHSYTKSFLQSRPLNTNAPSASNHMTVRRKPVPTSKQISTTEDTPPRTLKGHTRWIFSVAFSPDGSMVASASGDETIRLWDTVTGATLQTLEVPMLKGPPGSTKTNLVWSVAFSPDGMVVASASEDKIVRFWNKNGTVLQMFKGHTKSIRSVAFSPDGKVIASASEDKTIRIWDMTRAAECKILNGHTDRVKAVAFSPDSKVVASASEDETIRLWDAVRGTTIRTLTGHPGLERSVHWVLAIVFSPDGKVVASGSEDETIRLWDPMTGADLRTLRGHKGAVKSLAFSPDGRILVSASQDKSIRLWNAVTGAVVKTLKAHTQWVSSVAFSPDGKLLATGSGDETIQLWDMNTA